MRGPFTGKTWWQKTILIVGILIGLSSVFSDTPLGLLITGLLLIIGETVTEVVIKSRKKNKQI